VLQHQVERAAGEWLPTRDAARGARPQFALDAPGSQLVPQQSDRAEFGVAAKYKAHDLRLALDDDELAVLCPISERWHAAHPHSLPFRCVRVPVERDHGFRWKMITQSGGT